MRNILTKHEFRSKNRELGEVAALKMLSLGKEKRNPGQLPYGLTPAQLSKRHKSIPTNPILAHPVYLAGYIERIGIGTTDVLAAGLEAPVFEQDGDFKVTLWRKSIVLTKKST